MVRILLCWGMLVGIVAGFLAFGYAKIFGEPLVDRAIAFEDQMDRAKGEPPGPELVSRRVQSSVGLLTGVVVYGTALGGLFSLAFAFAYQRVGPASPRLTAALLAGAGFLSLVLVPQLKYPPNPPSVGQPEGLVYKSDSAEKAGTEQQLMEGSCLQLLGVASNAPPEAGFFSRA